MQWQVIVSECCMQWAGSRPYVNSLSLARMSLEICRREDALYTRPVPSTFPVNMEDQKQKGVDANLGGHPCMVSRAWQTQ